MGIKNLLVIVDSSEASDSRVELAASLAAEHAAHLVGLYILPLLEPDPSPPDPLIDKIVTAYIAKTRNWRALRGSGSRLSSTEMASEANGARRGDLPARKPPFMLATLTSRSSDRSIPMSDAR